MPAVDLWLAPGNGNNLSPNVCWLDQASASINWQAQFQFFNSGGSLMVISGASCGLWDVTAGANIGNVHFTNVNTININISTGAGNNNHTISLYVNYDSGTQPDHCLVTTTNTPGGSTHAVMKVERAGAFVTVGGPQLRIFRGGSWKPLSNITPCNDNRHTNSGGATCEVQAYRTSDNAWHRATAPW